MAQSVSIASGQGLTQGLKAYVEKLKKEGKIDGDVNISQSQWDATIHDLQGINDSRVKNNDPKGSIFSGGNGSNWSTNMIVNKGAVNYSDAEMNTLLADMGVKLKASTEPAKVATVDKKPATPSKAEKLDNWMITNAQKASKGEAVKDFELVGPEFANDINNNGGKNAQKIYNGQVGAVAKDYIGLYDKFGKKDGVVDFNEYKAKEKADYKKAFPNGTMNFNDPAYQAIEKKSFDNIDLNHNGVIDPDEMTTVLGDFDKNHDPKGTAGSGNINGNIRMKDYMAASALLPEDGAKAELKEMHKLLFGN